MHSLKGVWKIASARAFDGTGTELPPPLGSDPMGIVIFTDARMAGVVGDGCVNPPPEATARIFFAYTGSYQFDGETLTTRAEDASKPELIVEQVRRIRFEGPDRFVAIPMAGLGNLGGIEIAWDRVG
jgi:hypothetical protein